VPRFAESLALGKERFAECNSLSSGLCRVPEFLHSAKALLPVVLGASGGILLTASERFFPLQHLQTTPNTISANLVILSENLNWSLTGVYSPQTDVYKNAFMQQITNLKQSMLPAWLILGDFNLIYRAQDKNNNRINLTLLNAFNRTIDNLQLAPIEL
jgi:hypothetical protein